MVRKPTAGIQTFPRVRPPKIITLLSTAHIEPSIVSRSEGPAPALFIPIHGMAEGSP
ncbi:hypothetical protein NXC24_PA00013 (plasmid) [Rhizobium sp. NXC24]|nr:hypothetical protein NXC24_PA00013 [Rhizobium sp. NXC24]